MQIEIRPLRRENAQVVATVHAAAFPHSALARLGPPALVRYYDWLLGDAHPNAVRLGAWDGAAIVGFALGGRFNRAVAGFLQSNRGFLVRTVVMRPWLVITNAALRERAGVALRLLVRRPLDRATAGDHGSSFGILAIAVLPPWQERGVGRTLMSALEVAAREHAADCMHLTVARTNSRAIGFYRSLGWAIAGENKSTLTMTKPIVSRQADA